MFFASFFRKISCFSKHFEIKSGNSLDDTVELYTDSESQLIQCNRRLAHVD